MANVRGSIHIGPAGPGNDFNGRAQLFNLQSDVPCNVVPPLFLHLSVYPCCFTTSGDATVGGGGVEPPPSTCPHSHLWDLLKPMKNEVSP